MFEKVNPKHPDKVADRIAGAIVDLAYIKEENPRVAVEVLIGHGLCTIIGEISVNITLKEVKSIVYRIVETKNKNKIAFSSARQASCRKSKWKNQMWG